MSARGLEALFEPREVAVLGAAHSAGQRRLFLNLTASLPDARRVLVAAHADDEQPDWSSVRSLHQLPRVDLGVLFDGRLLRPATFHQLGGLGCRALIVATDVPLDTDAQDAARQAGVRVLGPRSAGVARPAGNFNACAFDQPIAAGRIALIAQSRTVAAAALDWARGRGLGLSWLATVGSEGDVDVADLLDHAALDPQVRGVVVHLGRVRAGRRFMSAARATAHLKPVAVLQTHGGGEVLFPALGADPVRSAAFARAGLVECESLGGLFDAIAALDERRQDAVRGVAVLGNGAGVCGLGVDALLREGVQPILLSAEVRRNLRARWPLVRFAAGAVDLGSTSAPEVAAVAEYLLSASGAGTVLLLHSPEPGQPHMDVARAVAASSHAQRIIGIWLGLDTAREARLFCAGHGVPTFASPEGAARALRYPREHLRTQEALMQTPPLWGRFAPDRRRVQAAVRSARSEAPPAPHAAVRLLEAYGVGRRHGLPTGPSIRLRMFRHPEFGSCLAVRADAAGIHGGEVFALPPLDAVLARRTLEAAGFRWDTASLRTRRDVQRLAIALIRVASLVIDQPSVAGFNVRLAVSSSGGHCRIVEARMSLEKEPLDEQRRLVLAPYPAALTQRVTLRDGLCFTVRAIRPEDEPAVIDMLEHTDPEAIRLRFFHMVRHFTHAMAARLSQIDYDRELVLVATDCSEAASAIVALGHLSIGDDDARAEYAILVHQDYARHGLGRDLLKRLIDYARTRGVAVVYGEVLVENTPMLNLCRQLGFRLRRDPDDPQCVRVEFDTSGEVGAAQAG